jgi:hypothetical protein
MLRAALLVPALLTPLAAAAGVPGDDAPIFSGHLVGELDADARGPIGLGGELRLQSPADLDLRARLVHTRLPPKDIEQYMLDNPEPAGADVPDSLAFSRWEARLQAAWSLRATERDAGLRLRAGAVGVIGGTAGATARLGPIGWSPDYTTALQLGPAVAVGWATPLSDDPGSALLDARLGASVAMPFAAGGGRLAAGEEDRAFALTVDDRTFRPAGLVGRESRAWIESTLTWRHLVIGAELGLEHNARSAVRRARAASPTWGVADVPEKVAPHAAVTVGVIF